MSKNQIKLTLLISILAVSDGLAQRAHELQVQFGVSFNRGVSFYTYLEPEGSKRHKFEFDQKYSHTFYNISWHYPINSYADAGVFFTHSISASLHLLEAESIVFDPANPGVRAASPLFLGVTRLASNVQEFGLQGRLYMIRSNKFKTYFVGGAGVQRIHIRDKTHNTIEAEHPGLKKNLLETYLISEDRITIRYGIGIAYLLANGISIKIFEVYGKNNTKSSLTVSAATSFEIRTGVSYQFYKRK